MVNIILDFFGKRFSKDIVGTISDGVSVMVKYGILLSAHLQMFYNHAIHLAHQKQKTMKSAIISIVR